MAARLLSVDPSLTCSGWALFDIETARLSAVGKVKAGPAELPLARRLSDLQGKIEQIFFKLELREPDVLVCESPTTMRDPRSAFAVEQVRCIFEVKGRDRGVAVPGRINPRSVQHEILGLRGKQLSREIVKDAAVSVTHRLYGDQLKGLGFPIDIDNLKRNQDIVDAVLIGSLALSHIQAALLVEEDLEVFFDRTRLKNIRRRRGISKRASR